jgi:hypothetical protein
MHVPPGPGADSENLPTLCYFSVYFRENVTLQGKEK